MNEFLTLLKLIKDKFIKKIFKKCKALFVLREESKHIHEENIVIEILKENACFWNEYYKFILAITLKLKINN